MRGNTPFHGEIFILATFNQPGFINVTFAGGQHVYC